jgi:hypothetical protein
LDENDVRNGKSFQKSLNFQKNRSYPGNFQRSSRILKIPMTDSQKMGKVQNDFTLNIQNANQESRKSEFVFRDANQSLRYNLMSLVNIYNKIKIEGNHFEKSTISTYQPFVFQSFIINIRDSH